MKKFRVFVTAFICFWGIPLFFIFSSFLADFMTDTLHLHVMPSYTGGEVAAVLEDAAGDELLPYPDHAAFEPGSLDLVSYTVHQPVYNAKWQQHAEYWQLDLEYASGPAYVRNIMVYIGIDSMAGGCTETLEQNAEQITFSKEQPWNLAVWIQDGKAGVYDSNRQFVCEAEYYELDEEKTVKVRIPLEKKELQALYTARKTWHTVVTGAYGPFEPGGFMPVGSKVYDVLEVTPKEVFLLQ